MLSIISGSTDKPVSAERLIDFFKTNMQDCEGYVYIGYPIIGTRNGPFAIDAMLISKQLGLVLFNLVEGKDISDYKDIQDESYNLMESKLRPYKELTQGRKLCVPISICTFAPLANVEEYDEEYALCNNTNLTSFFHHLPVWNGEKYHELVSALQSVSNIRKNKRNRSIKKDNSKGARLKKLEESISNLDNKQGMAVIETMDGVQRIRGLAGSGKTIVLALKAAFLHAKHPEWKIAVTFNSRALKPQYRQLISSFYQEQTNDEPDWSHLQILQAWGAPGGEDRDGIYYSFCKDHGIEYHDVQAAKSRTKPLSKNVFEDVCLEAVNAVEGRATMPVYDAILIDEAQDFSASFLRLCYLYTREPKRVIYAYDELQSLSEMSLPSPEIIFGNKENGKPNVVFEYHENQPMQDIILEKCYRNSRPALVTAHALGFGIYRDENEAIGTGIVQMFENTMLWEEIGYRCRSGKLADGQRVVLERTKESSPEFLENHSSKDDLIQFHSFNTKEEQDTYVVREIMKNLNEDELRYDDIMVINPNPLTTKREVANIRKILYNQGISSHITGVDTSPDTFYQDNSIAFTGIFRAKGNEGAMVYVINAQDCYESFGSLAKVRNQLFTAITRSKAWVRVLGVGNSMQKLCAEFEKVKENDYTLDFVYPSERQRKYLNVINRDMSNEEKSKVNKTKENINSLINDVENGNIYLEDLGEETIEKLRRILQEESYEDKDDY